MLTVCVNPKDQPNTEAIEFVVTYFPDSTLKEIAAKRNGLLNGRAFKFNEDGTKMWEFNYVNDKQEDIQYYYVHGRLSFAVPYENGKRKGWARRYTGPCGRVSEEGQYENDKMNGLWYQYYNKELLETGMFQDDSLVRIVYRNRKYPDRNIPLAMPLDSCCCEKPYEE